MLRGANIVTVTDTIVLSFATRYDFFWIVVKIPPTTIVADGGIVEIRDWRDSNMYMWCRHRFAVRDGESAISCCQLHGACRGA